MFITSISPLRRDIQMSKTAKNKKRIPEGAQHSLDNSHSTPARN